MKIGKLGIALALALGSTAASASEWWYIGTQSEEPHRIVYFVDHASVKDIGGKKRVWMAIVNESETYNLVRNQSMLLDIDCSEGKFHFLQDNTTFFSGEFRVTTPDGGWIFTPPDSAMDLIDKFVCGKLPADTTEVANLNGRDYLDVAKLILARKQ